MDDQNHDSDGSADSGLETGLETGLESGIETGLENGLANGLEPELENGLDTELKPEIETVVKPEVETEDEIETEIETGSETAKSTVHFSADDSGECIYENAGILQTASIPEQTKPLQKYEFGRRDSQNSLNSKHSEDFQDILSFETPSQNLRVWGVRGDSASDTPDTPSPRTSNPTEDKIAKEIKELKEREDELRRLRENMLSDSPVQVDPTPLQPETLNLKHPASHSYTQPSVVKPHSNSGKFDPALYRPVVLPPRSRIMQEFICNGGKVTAFTQPDNSVIHLRKPQVHKAQPKVSPPVAETRKHKTAIDKIQEELLETRRREDELKKFRKHLFSSTTDLSKDTVEGAEGVEGVEGVEGSEKQKEEEEFEEENEEIPSFQNSSGKSKLISVWENRIQCENNS